MKKLARILSSLVCVGVLANYLSFVQVHAADLGDGTHKHAIAPPTVFDPPRLAYSPWTFTITAYGWLPWVSGEMAVKGRSFDVASTPDKMIDALDWSGLPAWMSYAEARNGKLSLYNDIVYSQMVAAGSFARTAPGGPAALRLGGSVEADYQQAVIEIGAAYEVWANGSATTSRATALDLLAGARYWHQKSSFSADLGATLALPGVVIDDLEISGSRVIAKSGSVNWIDPVIGARLRHQIAPGQRLMLRGDMGGFGAGSNFSWQAIAVFEWQMLQRTSYLLDAYLGYRALYVNYEQGGGNTKYQYDMLQHGPVLGLTMRF
jgi:hypothetical protein